VWGGGAGGAIRSARALIADNAHTRELARHLPEEHPLAIQLLGVARSSSTG